MPCAAPAPAGPGLFPTGRLPARGCAWCPPPPRPPPAPAGRVVSHVPGRVRFRAPGLRGDPARAALMLAALRDEPGVRTACASTLTGTALVHYDPALVALARLRAVVESSA